MSEPLRVGLIGTGRIAHSHMTAYLTHPDRVQLVAVCDIIEPAARAYAKEAGVDAVYTDYEEMLARNPTSMRWTSAAPTTSTGRRPLPPLRRASMCSSRSRWRTRWRLAARCSKRPTAPG